MRAKRRDLTVDEFKYVLDRYAEGYSITDIAKELDMNKTTLSFRLKRDKFKFRTHAESQALPYINKKRAASLSGSNNPAWKGEGATPNRGRNIAHKLHPNIPDNCTRCGCHKTQTKRMERHHKDENPHNNAVENIQWLCAKCHKAMHPHPRWEH